MKTTHLTHRLLANSPAWYCRFEGSLTQTWQLTRKGPKKLHWSSADGLFSDAAGLSLVTSWCRMKGWKWPLLGETVSLTPKIVSLTSWSKGPSSVESLIYRSSCKYLGLVHLWFSPDIRWWYPFCCCSFSARVSDRKLKVNVITWLCCHSSDQYTPWRALWVFLWTLGLLGLLPIAQPSGVPLGRSADQKHLSLGLQTMETDCGCQSVWLTQAQFAATSTQIHYCFGYSNRAVVMDRATAVSWVSGKGISQRPFPTSICRTNSFSSLGGIGFVLFCSVCCFLPLALVGFQHCPESGRICCTSFSGFRPFFPSCIRDGGKEPGWALCLALSGCYCHHSHARRSAFRGLLLCT